MTGVALNRIPAVTSRIIIPGAGAWSVELDVDLGSSGEVPTGRAVISVGDESLAGTVDPRGTGKMGVRAHVRVVGGGGGWDKPVDAVHLHNDFGLFSTAVYQTTAAAVGEVVADPSPRRLGVDYVRAAGPASRVLRGVAWYVDASGITVIGKRPVLAVGPEVAVLEWDPLIRRAVLASDALVWPGALLVDDRFGRAVVKDVEQTFGPDGARVLASCETASEGATDEAGSRLARGLMAIARHAVGLTELRSYVYRVVLQAEDGRLTLQAVTKADGLPELLKLVPIWSSVAGLTQRLAASSLVLVEFINGDPALPIVTAIAPASGPPSKTTLAAARVEAGAGTSAAVLASTSLTQWMTIVTSTLNGLTAPGTVAPPTGFTATKLFGE